MEIFSYNLHLDYITPALSLLGVAISNEPSPSFKAHFIKVLESSFMDRYLS